MIPVIGIPYLSRMDLLSKMLDAIPRASVGRIHIIDNSPPDIALYAKPDPQLVITRMHHNIGVGAAWNLIIKANPHAAWWAILNSDLRLVAEDLVRLEEAMGMHEAVLMGGMSAFGLKPSAIEKAGFFDENFVPAYFEDDDWCRRAILTGVDITQITPPDHFGSATIRSSQHYAMENSRSFPQNARYYEAKWGGGVREETFTTPFDRGGSLHECSLDIRRLVELTWKE